MNHKWQAIFLSAFISMLAACSDKATTEKATAEKEHFLTEKMQTIKKAEQVEKMIQDATENQRRSIEEQGG
jgi:hypothetical protein